MHTDFQDLFHVHIHMLHSPLSRRQSVPNPNACTAYLWPLFCCETSSPVNVKTKKFNLKCAPLPSLTQLQREEPAEGDSTENGNSEVFPGTDVDYLVAERGTGETSV